MGHRGPGPRGRGPQRRWEFIWWGFGKKSREEAGFEPDAPMLRCWRFGPFELRLYEEDRRPPFDPDDDLKGPPSVPRLPGPE